MTLDSESRYGYCAAPCCAPIVSRTRGIPCFDTCARGHRRPAAQTVKQRRQAYVCGFMFDPDRGVVVLVEKDRPAWQAGLLNGLGGKIEPGDHSVHAAMAREFQEEEAGVETQPADWEEFATLVGPDFTVHMLRTFSDRWRDVRQMESEQVRWYPVSAVRAGAFPVVRNLAFLIPLALDQSGIQFPVVFNDGQPDEANAA